MAFSVCSIWRSVSGRVSAAVATRISDWRTSMRAATLPSSRSFTSRSAS